VDSLTRVLSAGKPEAEVGDRDRDVLFDQVVVDGHGGVGDDPAVVVSGATEAGQQGLVGHEARTDGHRSPGHEPAAVELDAGQAVVLDDEAGDGASWQ
jgi:hypothetical protein